LVNAKEESRGEAIRKYKGMRQNYEVRKQRLNGMFYQVSDRNKSYGPKSFEPG
jgi:hypothetical protein